MSQDSADKPHQETHNLWKQRRGQNTIQSGGSVFASSCKSHPAGGATISHCSPAGTVEQLCTVLTPQSRWSELFWNVVICLFSHFGFMRIQGSVEYSRSMDFVEIHSPVAGSFLRELRPVQSWQHMPLQSAHCLLCFAHWSLALHTCSLLVPAPDMLFYPCLRCYKQCFSGRVSV